MLYTLSFLLASALSAASAAQVRTVTPAPFAPPSPLAVSTHLLPLMRSGHPSRSSKILASQRYKPGEVTGGPYGTAPILSAELGEEFLTYIEWNGQRFTVILDTGSSDTWLAETGFACQNLTTGAPEPEAACLFGPLWHPDPEFKQIPDENFNLTYGDGEFITGVLGHLPITLAGITVNNQEVAAVNFAAWDGDGISSGLVGLAFPNITSAFKGTDPHNDTLANQVLYNPIFTNMYTEGDVMPIFSLAIDRGNGTGVMALGGVPPNLDLTGPYVVTPLEYVVFDGVTYASNQFYTINVSSVIGNSNKDHPFQAIVDSGTTLIYLPNAQANAFNAAFDPPAVYRPADGAFLVECNATVPYLAIDINGYDFVVDPRDLILPIGEKLCLSGVDRAGAEGLSILGDVFLKSVLAVFDVGANEMQFASRSY